MQSKAEKFLSLKDVGCTSAAAAGSLRGGCWCLLEAEPGEYKLHLVIFINWKVLRLCWYTLVYSDNSVCLAKVSHWCHLPAPGSCCTQHQHSVPRRRPGSQHLLHSVYCDSVIRHIPATLLDTEVSTELISSYTQNHHH